MHSTAHLQLSNEGPFDTVAVKFQPIGSRVTSARCSGSSSPPVPESVRSPRRPHLALLLQGAEVALNSPASIELDVSANLGVSLMACIRVSPRFV